MRALLYVLAAVWLHAADFEPAQLTRLHPLGGKAGTAVEVEILGTHLEGATVVQVRLETGRRNQIRVHFAEAGHPVLGDPRYEAELAQHARWPHQRLALHARLLGFEHPVTGQALRLESPLPAEYDRFLKAAGAKPSRPPR